MDMGEEEATIIRLVGEAVMDLRCVGNRASKQSNLSLSSGLNSRPEDEPTDGPRGPVWTCVGAALLGNGVPPRTPLRRHGFLGKRPAYVGRRRPAFLGRRGGLLSISIGGLSTPAGTIPGGGRTRAVLRSLPRAL